jgi:hypothetical protein
MGNKPSKEDLKVSLANRVIKVERQVEKIGEQVEVKRPGSDFGLLSNIQTRSWTCWSRCSWRRSGFAWWMPALAEALGGTRAAAVAKTHCHGRVQAPTVPQVFGRPA